jgi:hypothetical protein
MGLSIARAKHTLLPENARAQGMGRNPLGGFSCIVWLLMFYIEATAQVQIPGVRLELQTRASRFGVAYLEWLMLGTCQKIFPETTQFKISAEGLTEATIELETFSQSRRLMPFAATPEAGTKRWNPC